MRVLVCDDEKARLDLVIDAIRESGVTDLEVVTLIGGDLAGQLKKLFDIVDQSLNDGKITDAAGLLFDDADLTIFDNNLAHLRDTGARLTAEAVVGYVRAFSKARYIVSLNKNQDIDFDLRYLIGDNDTKADLALNTSHLENRAAWTGKVSDAKDRFHPWYWPSLQMAPQQRERQLAFAEKHLDSRVLTALGFPSDSTSLGFMSPHARGALDPDKAIEDVTFLNVFEASNRSIPSKEERQRIVEARKAGDPAASKVISRVVAADIDRWFRRDILGPQEMLVDLPHLLARMPFLISANTSVDAWNRTITERKAPFGLDKSLFEAHLEKLKFQHDEWISAPAFWWPQLKEDQRLTELFFTSKQGEWPDLVFCEDLSAFVPPTSAGGTLKPVEFTAEFEGSWARRYVAQLDDVGYAPRSRFAV